VLALYAADVTVKFINVAAEKAKAVGSSAMFGRGGRAFATQ